MGTSTTTVRQSNMELLRIVAMFLVLLLHATSDSLYIYQSPSVVGYVQSNPFSGFRLITTGLFSMIGINLFVLILGYLSIQQKARTLLSFVFMVLFYALASFLCKGIVGMESFRLSNLLTTVLEFFDLINSQFFLVGSYLVLLLVSPLLNNFVERSSRQRIRFSLLLFFGVYVIWYWVFLVFLQLDIFYWIEVYSWILFSGLYLLGRYLRLYPLRLTTMKENRSRNILYLIGGGIILLFLPISLLFLSIYTKMGVVQMELAILGSIAPNTILLSLIVFLLFTLIDLRSRWINWIAASSFSVYLIHNINPLYSYFLNTVKHLYHSIDSPWLYAPVLLLFLSGVFMGCVLIDQLRLLAWKYVGPPVVTYIEKLFYRFYQRL